MNGKGILKNAKHSYVVHLTSLLEGYERPSRLLVVTLLSVFISEVVVMFIISRLSPIPLLVEALVDGLLLTVLIFPLLYICLLHPMKAHIDQRKQAELNLQKANSWLEEKVEERTAELDIVNEELKQKVEHCQRAQKKLLAYQDELHHLTAELSITESRERRKIATDLHDRIGQSLFLANLKLESIVEFVQDTNVCSIVNEIHELIDRIIEETRSLIIEISPPVLRELGFEAALKWLAAKTQREHKIRVDFHDNGQPKPLDDDLKDLLFRIVHELVMNVIRHASAHRVTLSVQSANKGIRVRVTDDGVGFSASSDSNSKEGTKNFGLFSMRERLKPWSGSLSLDSKPGKGTRATLIVPWKDMKLKKAG